MNFALNTSLFLIKKVTTGGIVWVSILTVFGIVCFIINGVFKRKIKKMQEDKNKEQNESYHERADKENRTNFEEAYIRTYRNEFLDELKARLKRNGAKYIEQFKIWWHVKLPIILSIHSFGIDLESIEHLLQKALDLSARAHIL